jgi:hypothetical protein
MHPKIFLQKNKKLKDSITKGHEEKRKRGRWEVKKVRRQTTDDRGDK